MRALPIERLLALVDATGRRKGECWEWTGVTTGDGYGRFHLDDRMVVAHRAAYELLVGPVPPDLDLDHLCRNRRCVRPSHMEPVTRSVNLGRGLGPHIPHRGPDGRWLPASREAVAPEPQGQAS